MSYAGGHKDLPTPFILWDDYRIVLVVAEAKSLNLAAKILGINQGTISRRIDRVESALSVKLFVRSGRGAQLTPQGQRFIDEAAAAKVMFGRAVERARGSKESAGEVKIAITDGLATYWLTRHLGWFHETNPHVLLRIQSFDRIIDDKTDVVDCQLQLFDPIGEVPVTYRLATLHYIPYAGRSYAEARGLPRTISDLSSHKLIDLTHYMLDKGNWATMTGNDRISDSFGVLTNSSSMLVESVRMGAGISLLPTYLSVVYPDLVPCEIGLHFSIPAWLVHRRERSTAFPSSAAIDFMRHAFDRKSMPWFADEYIPPKEYVSLTSTC